MIITYFPNTLWEESALKRELKSIKVDTRNARFKLRAIFQDLNILHPGFCNSNKNVFVRDYTKIQWIQKLHYTHLWNPCIFSSSLLLFSKLNEKIQYTNYHTDSLFEYKNAEFLTLSNIPQKYCLYTDFQDLFVKLFLLLLLYSGLHFLMLFFLFNLL